MDAERTNPANSPPPANAAGEATRLLVAINKGDPSAAEHLLPLVYEELRRLASARVAKEPGGLTLQPTALVHEAYLRLVGQSNAQWKDHSHFFAAAALAMRRILIDRARRKESAQGMLAERRHAAAFESDADPEAVDLVALDDALDKLSTVDPRLTEVVHLRFFAGLTVEQASEVMGISERTFKRDWQFARAWLHNEIAGGDDSARN